MKYVALFCCAWYLWVPVTFVFGRVFCRFCCPLGLCQSLVNLLFHPKSHVRRVCTELPRPWYQRAVNWALVAAYFLVPPVAVYVNPWGIVGRVYALFVPGIVIFAAVLALAAFGRGRWWCNWICPYGTIFDLIARVSWRRDRPKGNCRHCRACFAASAEPPQAAGSESGVTRRETLRGVATLAAVELAEKTTDGGYAAVSLPGIPERTIPILPPGSVDGESFRSKCVGCGLCVTACPEKVLRPSTSLRSFGQPVMVFQGGHCRLACDYRCGEVCPTGAILRRDGILRSDAHMGVAKWRRDLCLRATRSESCTACVRKCPVRAITLVEGIPVVNADRCVGCGACEHVCPARPMPAIRVEGLPSPRYVRRMSEGDLIAEMVARIEAGAAAVAAKEGVIVGSAAGHGVEPLEALFAQGALKGALVVDRVIGRAAAAVCIAGGARKVYARVMSEGARELLAAHGVASDQVELVKEILNRDRTGRCPLETAVDGEADPAKMIEKLRAFPRPSTLL